MFVSKLNLHRRSAAIVLIFSMLILPLQGCGTLFGGNSLDMKITSYPPGAKVKHDGELIGKTPLELKIDPLEDNKIEARADGYVDYEGEVELTVNIPTVFNILFPPFFLVDLVTGKWAKAKDLEIVFVDEEGNSAKKVDNDW